MAFANDMAVKSPAARDIQPLILERFKNPLDSLTAHLMLECSEVGTLFFADELILIFNIQAF